MSPRILFEIENERSTSAIAVGDVFGAGHAGLCTGGRDGRLRLYDLNHNEIRLMAQREFAGSVLALRIADANNDGQLEIVVGRSLGPDEKPGRDGTLQIYRYVSNGGGGEFELLAQHAIDRFVTSVHVADVNGDGKYEILAGGSDSTFRVVSLDAENHITELVCHHLEDMPISIGTCDVVGDEVEEIVIGNRDNTLRIFSVEDSKVVQLDVINLPSPVISLAAGDLLGDRKRELGVVTFDGSVRIYRNEESKLELFSILEGADARSIRMAELNADHMDEIVVATSDNRIVFYNLYMAELQEIASIEIGQKILAIDVDDAGGDDRKEVLVGVADGPLKVIEGLYQLIPKFEVQTETAAGTELIGRLTVVNVSDQPVKAVSGKLYWFPKDHMQVEPQMFNFDIGPLETRILEIRLRPKVEGTVIIRPIVLMWTEEKNRIKQVTTPETAILVKEGVATAAPSVEAPVSLDEVSSETAESPPPSLFAPVVGTGFAPLSVSAATSEVDEPPVVSEDSLRAAEKLLDTLFGDNSASVPDTEVLRDIKELVTASSSHTDATTSESGVESSPTVSEVPVTVTPSLNESALVAEIRSRPPKPPRPGTSKDAYSYLFKTMIIGEGAVGKTTLVNRYVTGVFERDYKTTIGSQFAVKHTYISPPDSQYAVGVKIQAWDVAGQARFAAVRKMYYSGAAGVILVFDVTRRRSFTELPKWVQEADESIGVRVPMICVGNKVDLPDRAVSSEEAKTWAESQGFLYMESSAKTGEGVADMFTVLAELMYNEARKSADSTRNK